LEKVIPLTQSEFLYSHRWLQWVQTSQTGCFWPMENKPGLDWH